MTTPQNGCACLGGIVFTPCYKSVHDHTVRSVQLAAGVPKPMAVYRYNNSLKRTLATLVFVNIAYL